MKHCASPKDVSEKEGVEKANDEKEGHGKMSTGQLTHKHTAAMVAYIVLAQDQDSKQTERG